jgi:hypothetical protein
MTMLESMGRVVAVSGTTVAVGYQYPGGFDAERVKRSNAMVVGASLQEGTVRSAAPRRQYTM